MSIEVQPLERTFQWSGEVMIYARINPSARYNTTITVDYRCIDTGCGSVNVPQCKADIPCKCLSNANLNY